MKQHASVYRYKGIWYVISHSMTTAGVWMGCDPVIRIDVDKSTDEEKGKAILTALAASRQNVPHPIDPNIETCSLRQAVGVRTWNELEKKTQLVTVDNNENGFTIIPWRRSAKSGFVGVDGKEAVFPVGLSAATLGREVENSFAVCHNN